MLARGFSELRAAGAERVLEERRDGLDAVDEPRGELPLAESERGADEFGQAAGVVGVARDADDLFELDQERARPLWVALGEQQPCCGRERHREQLRLPALARSRD